MYAPIQQNNKHLLNDHFVEAMGVLEKLDQNYIILSGSIHYEMATKMTLYYVLHKRCHPQKNNNVKIIEEEFDRVIVEVAYILNNHKKIKELFTFYNVQKNIHFIKKKICDFQSRQELNLRPRR
jgi:hypothetical protein